MYFVHNFLFVNYFYSGNFNLLITLMRSVLPSMCCAILGCVARSFGGKRCFCAAYVSFSETSAEQPRPARKVNPKTRQTLTFTSLTAVNHELSFGRLTHSFSCDVKYESFYLEKQQ